MRVPTDPDLQTLHPPSRPILTRRPVRTELVARAFRLEVGRRPPGGQSRRRCRAPARVVGNRLACQGTISKRQANFRPTTHGYRFFSNWPSAAPEHIGVASVTEGDKTNRQTSIRCALELGVSQTATAAIVPARMK